MYFESNRSGNVTTQPEEQLLTQLIDSFPVLDFQTERKQQINQTEGNDMNFTKEYSTYHSENTCRDWMLTD